MSAVVDNRLKVIKDTILCWKLMRSEGDVDLLGPEEFVDRLLEMTEPHRTASARQMVEEDKRRRPGLYND